MELKEEKNLKLKPFQKKSIKEIMRFFKGGTPTLRKISKHMQTRSAYLANDMGLGKTPTAVVLADMLNVKKILVVCPALMRLVWRNEIVAWSKTFTEEEFDIFAVLSTSRRVKEILTPLRNRAKYVVITSYDLATPSARKRDKHGNPKPDNSIRDQILKLAPFDLVVFDEAHLIKNRKSKRSKVCFNHYFKNSKYRLLMSGTPCTVHVTDLYTPLHAMLPSVFTNFWDFAEEFSNPVRTPWAVKYEGIKNGKKLKRFLRDTVLVRYTKDQVLKQLPEKQFVEIPLPSELAVKPPTKAEEKKRLEEQVKKIVNGIESGKEDIPVPTHIASIRKAQGLKKLKHVEEFIRSTVVDNGEPLIVFYYHRDFVTQLAGKTKDLSPEIIQGGTPDKLRNMYVEDFQSGKIDLLYIQIRAGGLGVTLTRARMAFLAEIDWSPSVIIQAVDRLHRIGQTRNVIVYWMPVERSIDRRIELAVIERAKDFKILFDNR
jgi:SWI/SNF-related matrix-associated actin-dependent regulator 1 of chromatin subfamily A